MSIKGLEQAIANLNSISKRAVPRASAQTGEPYRHAGGQSQVCPLSRNQPAFPKTGSGSVHGIRRATVEKPRALIPHKPRESSRYQTGTIQYASVTA